MLLNSSLQLSKFSIINLYLEFKNKSIKLLKKVKARHYKKAAIKHAPLGSVTYLIEFTRQHQQGDDAAIRDQLRHARK